MGVGEEEWGSGEREVLEGFVQRTDGLVDLLVSRYGDTTADENGKPGQRTTKEPNSSGFHHGPSDQNSEPELSPSDGMIFSGTGAITSESVRAIAGWMEWLHVFGEDAYGVRENPNSTSRRKGRHNPPEKREVSTRSRAGNDHVEGSWQVRAPSDIRAHGMGDRHRLEDSQFNTPPKSTTLTSVTHAPIHPPAYDGVKHNDGTKQSIPNEVPSTTGTTTLMKYLTLGYGSSWGTSLKPKNGEETEAHRGHKDLENPTHSQSKHQANQATKSTGERVTSSGPTSRGRFMIGLQGPLESETGDENNVDPSRDQSEYESETEERRGRIYLRTINVNLTNHDQPEMDGDGKLLGIAFEEGVSSVNSSTGFDIKTAGSSPQKLRVIVYKVGPQDTISPG